MRKSLIAKKLRDVTDSDAHRAWCGVLNRLHRQGWTGAEQESVVDEISNHISELDLSKIAEYNTKPFD